LNNTYYSNQIKSFDTLANTVQNDYEIGSNINLVTTIVVDVLRYRKPFNIEDNPNNSDVN